MRYIVVFTDGRFLSVCGNAVSEYPEAEIFPNKRAAERAAQGGKVVSTDDYKAGVES